MANDASSDEHTGTDKRGDEASGSEQVERATDAGPEPDTRHDSRGERHPEPFPHADDETPQDEEADEVLERQRREADRLEQHGDGGALESP